MKAKDPKRNKEIEPEAPTAPQRDVKSIPLPSDEQFFLATKTFISSLPRDRGVLINVPIWGWPGDGKTCALLTAINFCDPLQHGIGFADVSDLDELEKLEQEHEAYRGLGLATGAAATKERLRNLQLTFLENNEWPPGTDSPAQYILEIRSAKGALGYAALPDIRGGSYQETDPVARAILTSAHAFILIVDPNRFANAGPSGKKYQDEVIGRIQRNARSQIPTCVLITKADRVQPGTRSADDTENKIKLVVTQQDHFTSVVMRVSVIGPNVRPETSELPPVEERNPEALVRAFLWTTMQALAATDEKILGIVPPIHLSNTTATSKITPKSLPELRLVREFSDGSGHPVHIENNGTETKLMFLSESGLVTRILVGKDGLARSLSSGTLPEWDSHDALDVKFEERNNSFVAGQAHNPSLLWVAHGNDEFRAAKLPVDLRCWASVSGHQVVGVDQTGRLQLLTLSGDAWKHTNFLADFIKPSDVMYCATSGATVFAANGTSASAVVLAGELFGDRVAAPSAVRFESNNTAMSEDGFVATIGGDNKARMGTTKAFDCGDCHPEYAHLICVASRRPLTAFIDATARIRAAGAIADKAFLTSAELAQPIPSPIVFMKWQAAGTSLAVGFENGSWAIYRLFGVRL